MSIQVPFLLHHVGMAGGSGRGRNMEEQAMMDDQTRNRQVEILTDQNILLDFTNWRRPAQFRKLSNTVLIQESVVIEHGGTGRATLGGFQGHVRSAAVLERAAVGELAGVMAADKVEEPTQAKLEIGKDGRHNGI